MLPSVAVVIPTHGRRDLVGRAVDAVLTDPATTEVIVVDDDSADDTYDMLCERARHEPRLRPLRVVRGGPAAARQAGVEHSTSDVVLLLDDDVIAEPGLVAGHARHHRDRADVVVVGYMPTRTPRRRQRGQFASFLYAADYEWATRRWQDEPASVLHHLWGGNVSLRRDVAVRIGLVAPGPRLPYREDQELGIRLEHAGLHGVFDPTLLAWHEHTRDLAAFLREARNRGAGALLVHRAHPDELGPLQLECYESSLPAPARTAVRLARHRVAARSALAVLRATIVGAGVVHWWKLESLAAIVAMHIIEVRTIIDAEGDGRPPSP